MQCKSLVVASVCAWINLDALTLYPNGSVFVCSVLLCSVLLLSMQMGVCCCGFCYIFSQKLWNYSL